MRSRSPAELTRTSDSSSSEKHPNPNIPTMKMADETRNLADELGLTGEPVFFNDAWVPTTTEPTIFSTQTSASAPTTSTSRRPTPSGPASSTTCGPPCRSSAPTATPSPTSSATTTSAASSRRRTSTPSPRRSKSCCTTQRRATGSPGNVAAYASEHTWQSSLRPLIEFCMAPTPAPDRLEGIVSERTRVTNDLRKRIRGLEASSSAPDPTAAGDLRMGRCAPRQAIIHRIPDTELMTNDCT